ncbi:uncharacterized protein LOC124479783 isoform X2 [Hypomesus transpacificus]|uniref:uncharacterized protein LOC124479783 isoform X2 n=1 Tax=Hypomesus transpacificus TaxID=137520 RepID=UPI001F088175|nr:uncharacterized protein LOC124479783 isoform X2 [Hypomesus transpacificus]
MVSHKIPFWMLLVVVAFSAIKESMVHLSCHLQKTVDGNFKYQIDARNATDIEISLSQDKMKIAIWTKDEGFKFEEMWVKAMDNTSITLHQCHNLTLYKLYPQNEEETIYYNMAGDEKSYELSTATPAEQHENLNSFPPWVIGMIVFTLAALGLLVCGCRKNRILARIWNQRQDANNHSLLPPDVTIYMPTCCQGEEDQAGETGEPEEHNELNPFIHPDSSDQIQEGLEENHLEEYVVNMDEQEPGQDREEGECKPAEKGNAEQTGAGMLEHGDCTTRDVVSGDAVEAHSPQDDPLVALNKEERHSEYSHSCGVTKTSGKGKRDNTKNSGGTERTQEEQPNNVEFVGTTTNEERIV